MTAKRLFLTAAAHVALMAPLPAGHAMGLFRPATQNRDASKALAEINQDNGVNVTKAATEQPPVSVTANGARDNEINVTVTPNKSQVTTASTTKGGADQTRTVNTDDSTTWTLGQKMIFLALGIGLLGALAVWAWRAFKVADPQAAAALSGLASVADTAAAAAINRLRLMLAAEVNPVAKLAYTNAIAEIEAARGKTAAAAPTNPTVTGK